MTHHLFPFDKVPKGSRIVLCGAETDSNILRRLSEYNENDYIRDYDEFCALRRNA
ncbi:MAG: FdtA/QdtA family cupin domain-containing protein [Fibromonadaceae bacterium]|jgi:hypothetical protein|nr:FdtA/QdtA family cupin domain-containing protein [Fibromonadaceae bacterium]